MRAILAFFRSRPISDSFSYPKKPMEIRMKMKSRIAELEILIFKLISKSITPFLLLIFYCYCVSVILYFFKTFLITKYLLTNKSFVRQAYDRTYIPFPPFIYSSNHFHERFDVECSTSTNP